MTIGDLSKKARVDRYEPAHPPWTCGTGVLACDEHSPLAAVPLSRGRLSHICQPAVRVLLAACAAWLLMLGGAAGARDKVIMTVGRKTVAKDNVLEPYPPPKR